MSIRNREDANKYYKIANDLVDDFQKKLEKRGGKVRPSELKESLKPDGSNFKKLIDRNELKDVVGIDRIFSDVIQDRFYMESDKVLTFESFGFLESDEFKINSLAQCLTKGIGRVDINMEKKVADYFDTNLGEIDVVDTDRHIMRVKGWDGEGKEIIVFTAAELEVIKVNVMNYLYEELSGKKIELTKSISVDLSDLINKDSFKYKMHSVLKEDVLIQLITDCYFDFSFEKEDDGYFIWIS